MQKSNPDFSRTNWPESTLPSQHRHPLDSLTNAIGPTKRLVNRLRTGNSTLVLTSSLSISPDSYRDRLEYPPKDCTLVLVEETSP